MKLIRLLLINLLVLMGLLGFLEILARFHVDYHPGYYTGVKKTGECIDYPYGRICLNSDGFPSRHGDHRERSDNVIGYFGDSVCYGVGAGMGYRITDLLEQRFPELKHLNYCRIGETPIRQDSFETLLELGRRTQHMVLLFNLNDIAPLVEEMDSASGFRLFRSGVIPNAYASDTEVADWKSGLHSFLSGLRNSIYPLDEFLRGHSYLYNLSRTHIKNWMSRQGFEASGYRAIELFPSNYPELIKYAAEKINRIYESRKAGGMEFSVVFLPYEMQISEHAASVYSDLGVSWEKEFLSGNTQQMIIQHLKPEIRYFNAMDAFSHLKQPIQVGEYFVYNRGDKLDWNHPNREGHRVIADFLVEAGLFRQN